jgi:hypothetical protein
VHQAQSLKTAQQQIQVFKALLQAVLVAVAVAAAEVVVTNVLR